MHPGGWINTNIELVKRIFIRLLCFVSFNRRCFACTCFQNFLYLYRPFFVHGQLPVVNLSNPLIFSRDFLFRCVQTIPHNLNLVPLITLNINRMQSLDKGVSFLFLKNSCNVYPIKTYIFDRDLSSFPYWKSRPT